MLLASAFACGENDDPAGPARAATTLESLTPSTTRAIADGRTTVAITAQATVAPESRDNWVTFYASAGDFAAGDFTGDGIVDHLDFDVLYAHFGDVRTANGIAEGAAVPEPAGMTLIMLATAGLTRRRRRA